MLDSPALSAAFPGKKPLERLFLGFLIANTAAQLCGEYRYECWDRRDASEQLTYMVPTSAATYSVCRTVRYPLRCLPMRSGWR